MLFCSFEVLGQGALKGFVYWAIGRLFDLWVNLFLSSKRGGGSTFRVHFSGYILIKIWVKFGSNLGLTILKLVFARAQTRKSKIAFAVFLTAKSGFFHKKRPSSMGL